MRKGTNNTEEEKIKCLDYFKEKYRFSFMEII